MLDIFARRGWGELWRLADLNLPTHRERSYGAPCRGSARGESPVYFQSDKNRTRPSALHARDCGWLNHIVLAMEAWIACLTEIVETAPAIAPPLVGR